MPKISLWSVIPHFFGMALCHFCTPWYDQTTWAYKWRFKFSLDWASSRTDV